MRILVYFVILMLSINDQANAGAWLLPKKKEFLSQGTYYSFPSEYDIYVELNEGLQEFFHLPDRNNNSQYTFTVKQYKIGYTYLIENGLSDVLNFIGKLEIENLKASIRLKDSNNPASNYKENIASVDMASRLGIKALLAKDNNSIHSTSISIIPGNFFMDNTKDDLQYNHKTSAIEFALHYGYSGTYFINYYWDNTIGYRKYLSTYSDQVNFDLKLGIKPTRKILLQLGLYNTFGNAYSSLNKSMEESFHQISLKFGYEFKPNKVINIEGITNILAKNSFKNNTILISYDTNF